MPAEATLPRGCEILVLEDDATLRKRLAAHLRALETSPTEAGSLAEARRLLAAMRFDFALIDLHLPDGESERIHLFEPPSESVWMVS